MTITPINRVGGAFLFIAMALCCLAGCNRQDDGASRISDQAVTYAETHWTYYDAEAGELGSYLAYEYWVAANFGPDGELSGTVKYAGSIAAWQQLTWLQKKSFLPAEGFPDELQQVNRGDQYYELIGQSDQFAAGWPSDGDSPYNYRFVAHYTYPWTANNSYRIAYFNMIGGGGP